MIKDKTLILNGRQISQKIERIAHHIHEIHYKEKEIVIVGIKERGYLVAERITKVLEEISDIKVELHSIELNKDKPLNTVVYNGELGLLQNRVVILVDDVLNSGRTLIYAASEILTANPRILATATLVDRIHRKFPIRADYVGLTLSTNLKERIAVEMGGKNEAVYLE